MNHAIPGLQIRIYKTDGSIWTFVQNDIDRSKRILDEFEPARLFDGENLALWDENSRTPIPVSRITRVDLDSQHHSHLRFARSVVEAEELTGAEFEKLIQNLAMPGHWENTSAEDAPTVAFLSVEMTDRRRVLLTMEVSADWQYGLSELREHLSNRSALCFRLSDGGVGVLNLANLARVAFFPGALQPPADAWPFRQFPGGPDASPAADAQAALVAANSSRTSFSPPPRAPQLSTALK